LERTGPGACDVHYKLLAVAPLNCSATCDAVACDEARLRKANAAGLRACDQLCKQMWHDDKPAGCVGEWQDEKIGAVTFECKQSAIVGCPEVRPWTDCAFQGTKWNCRCKLGA